MQDSVIRTDTLIVTNWQTFSRAPDYHLITYCSNKDKEIMDMNLPKRR